MDDQAGVNIGGGSNNNNNGSSAGENSGSRQNGSGQTAGRSRLLDKPVQLPRRGTVLKTILCKPVN